MRRLPRLFAFGLAAIALSACATGPAPRPLVASVTGAEGAFQGAPHSDWPTSAWWETFGDPQLDALIDEGLKGSPTLAQAAARVRTAQALTAQTASQSLPKLSGSASYTEVKADFPPVLTGYNDTGLLLLNFGWDLDFFGRNRAAVAAAVSDARAAQAEAAEARLGLTTAIAATWRCARRPKDWWSSGSTTGSTRAPSSARRRLDRPRRAPTWRRSTKRSPRHATHWRPWSEPDPIEVWPSSGHR
jgi:hypothetical protein